MAGCARAMRLGQVRCDRGRVRARGRGRIGLDAGPCRGRPGAIEHLQERARCAPKSGKRQSGRRQIRSGTGQAVGGSWPDPGAPAGHAGAAGAGTAGARVPGMQGPEVERFRPQEGHTPTLPPSARCWRCGLGEVVRGDRRFGERSSEQLMAYPEPAAALWACAMPMSHAGIEAGGEYPTDRTARSRGAGDSRSPASRLRRRPCGRSADDHGQGLGATRVGRWAGANNRADWSARTVPAMAVSITRKQATQAPWEPLRAQGDKVTILNWGFERLLKASRTSLSSQRSHIR